MREVRDIQTSEVFYKMKYMEKKKEVKVLIRAILDLSKTIRKLKKQEEFLNELLDEREEELKTTDNPDSMPSPGVEPGSHNPDINKQLWEKCNEIRDGSANPDCKNPSRPDKNRRKRFKLEVDHSPKDTPEEVALNTSGSSGNQKCTNKGDST